MQCDEEANWKTIRQVHTDRCHAPATPHVNRSIKVDAVLQVPVLEENVEENR